MSWCCQYEFCMDEATCTFGNEPADRHYCDQHAEIGLREYLSPTLRPGGRLCKNCGEPLENHVGGVERGLCKNPANRPESEI